MGGHIGTGGLLETVSGQQQGRRVQVVAAGSQVAQFGLFEDRCGEDRGQAGKGPSKGRDRSQRVAWEGGAGLGGPGQRDGRRW